MGIANLASSRAKLGRAYEHLVAFNEVFRRFAEQDANTAHTAYRREGDWYVVELGPVPAVPPRIALIAGDCLNNIRTALDHLVWQLVLREDQEPRPTHCFPIFDARQDFIKVKMRAEKGDKGCPLYGIRVKEDAWAIIEAAQPYHRPQPEIDTLMLLARLNNIDKHRTLLVQKTFLTSGTMFWPADVKPVERRLSFAPLSAEHPTEIVRARFAPGVDIRTDTEGKVSVTPTIGDGKTQAKLTILADAHQRVGEILDKVAGLPRVQS